MSAFVSRCPNCDTSFKVTEAQLSAADGAVRCGACLQIFVASDYFVEAPIPDLFQQEADEDGESEGISVLAEESTGETEVLEDEAADADSFQSDLSQSEPPEGVTAEIVDQQEPVEDISAGAVDDEAQVEKAQIEAVQGENVQVESDLAETAPAETAQLETAPIKIWTQEAAAVPVDLPPAPDGVPDRTLDPDEHPQPDITLSTTEIVSGLEGLAASEPEELVGNFVPTRSYKIGRWLVGSILLFIVFGMQYFWANKNVLAMDVRFRPYFQSVCNLANCELPDFLDAQLLSTTDLVVRTHPTIENGLVVDAILRNEASYRQRFPLLTLRFADINGNTLAQRTFSPDLYLAGELAGMQYIPAITEVRLSLDIVDPGPGAVSYSMLTVIN